jgi:putative spermidine/putrescine transport system substrate-binding protein
VILGEKEKLLETITETEVPSLKHVWQESRTIVPPTGIVHGYQNIALLWNKTHLEMPASWASYWDPGPAYGGKIKGHVIAFEPANLLSVHALIMAAKLKGGGVDKVGPAWELLRAQSPWVGVSVMASDAAAPYFENDQHRLRHIRRPASLAYRGWRHVRLRRTTDERPCSFPSRFQSATA